MNIVFFTSIALILWLTVTISHLKRLQRLFLLTSGHTVSYEHEVFKALKELNQAKAWDVTGFTQSKSHSVTYLSNESFRSG